MSADVLPTPLTLGLAFLAGVTGTAHCVGMCGGLVLTVGRAAESTSVFRAQALYATGRVLAYGLLGAIFGLVGSTLAFRDAFSRTQGWFTLAAGAAVILLAIARIGPWGELAPGSALGMRIHRALRPHVGGSPALAAFFLMGTLNSLVPCGLLYTMHLRAAATGSALGGASLLLAFGLGTAPLLLLFGALGGRLSLSRRLWLDRIASVVLLALGLQILLRGAAQVGWLGQVPPGCH